MILVNSARYVLGVGCLIWAVMGIRMVLVYLGAVASATVPVMSYRLATMSLRKSIASVYYAVLLFVCREWTVIAALVVLFWCVRCLTANFVRKVWMEYLANYAVAQMRQIDPEFAEATGKTSSAEFQEALQRARQIIAEDHGYELPSHQ